ncbi:Ras GTPase-activating protein-binding protein 1-like protein isoform X1 [Tanacetum coccineum]
MMVFPFSSTLHDPRKAQPRNQEQQVNNVPPTASAIEAAASNVDAVENGIHEEEADGYSIYIKGLPMSATPAMLDDEFKKFGTIKSNGIQVRSNRRTWSFQLDGVILERGLRTLETSKWWKRLQTGGDIWCIGGMIFVGRINEYGNKGGGPWRAPPPCGGGDGYPDGASQQGHEAPTDHHYSEPEAESTSSPFST